ncbi:hypothetical protein H632_c51p1 [Helicosporidium sp. ATCC 50920]|nr:hypothetical protein H632_c51p1 [Helicosporidium sp. ATCC 50920]|eukprot:KDD76972.1 hypothetical protein H632_c51p1 [Helicosporidium sp. ATCC 50920]
MAQDAEPVDPLRQFSDLLRGKEGVESRTAVLEAHRVEILRGKDFARYVAAHDGELQALIQGGEKPTPHLPKALCELLLRRRLLFRCERQFKKPPPGAKKLVKFPRKVVRASPAEALSFAEDAFFAWTYERPPSKWTPVLTGLGLLGVLLACLFPIAPSFIKAGVFYAAASLLSLILLILAVRCALAVGVWLLLGQVLWLLPNLLSEELPIAQLFSPLLQLQAPQHAGSWVNHPATRAAVASSLLSTGYVMYSHAPSTEAVANEAVRYRDELFDFFNINARSTIAGRVEEEEGGESGAEPREDKVPGQALEEEPAQQAQG